MNWLQLFLVETISMFSWTTDIHARHPNHPAYIAALAIYVGRGTAIAAPAILI